MATLNQIVAVVDDDESVCRAVKRLLRSVRIKAETFSSGEEFLGTLSSTASYLPACVVLDFQMPGINGLELQRRLAPTGVPVICITGHNDPAVREKALASGAAACLRKPFNNATLVKAVEIALGAAP
ncbi:response regulator [Paraburkholderia panacisoli]|uniref:Response regulator n=1 Tax=Paraburkholderia panacisoli TaxID=2603818 RepID=A0A5B0G3C9_9BURK|nr:response regulator [Paraburkholderia panacisoli]KAA0998003.1 response regulator [Paraburkholderia panacisoli]